MSKDSRRLRGKLFAFNISQKGNFEGALVETAAGIAQHHVVPTSGPLITPCREPQGVSKRPVFSSIEIRYTTSCR